MMTDIKNKKKNSKKRTIGDVTFYYWHMFKSWEEIILIK